MLFRSRKQSSVRIEVTRAITTTNINGFTKCSPVATVPTTVSSKPAILATLGATVHTVVLCMLITVVEGLRLCTGGARVVLCPLGDEVLSTWSTSETGTSVCSKSGIVEPNTTILSTRLTIRPKSCEPAKLIGSEASTIIRVSLPSTKRDSLNTVSLVTSRFKSTSFSSCSMSSTEIGRASCRERVCLAV